MNMLYAKVVTKEDTYKFYNHSEFIRFLEVKKLQCNKRVIWDTINNCEFGKVE